MAKGKNYAKMFTLRSDGRYQGKYKDQGGKWHTVCDRDPEKLYFRIEDLKKPKQFTFREIAEDWKEAHWQKIEKGTQTSYNPAYNRAIEWYGDKPASDITIRDIDVHLMAMQAKDYSTQTIGIQRTVYRLIFNYAMTSEKYHKEITNNPTTYCPVPKGKPKEKREAPEEMTTKVIQKNWKDYRFGLFPLFLINTGMRRGEALAIQWKDIDMKADVISVTKAVKYNGTMEIGDPKTASGVREIPLFPELKRALNEIKPKNAKAADYVFHGEDPSKPMAESVFKRQWEQFLEDSNVGHLTPHQLRHGFATVLFEQQVDEYTAQTIMGHSDIRTTHSIYTHLRKKQKDKSIKKLNRYFA